MALRVVQCSLRSWNWKLFQITYNEFVTLLWSQKKNPVEILAALSGLVIVLFSYPYHFRFIFPISWAEDSRDATAELLPLIIPRSHILHIPLIFYLFAWVICLHWILSYSEQFLFNHHFISSTIFLFLAEYLEDILSFFLKKRIECKPHALHLTSLSLPPVPTERRQGSATSTHMLPPLHICCAVLLLVHSLGSLPPKHFPS